MRFSRRKLRQMRKRSARSIRQQARASMRVLRKQAQKMGLARADAATAQAGAWISNPRKPTLTEKQQQAVRAAYAVAAGRRAAKLAWEKVMRKMDAGTARRARLSISESTRSVAAATAMKALVHELQPVAKKVHKAKANVHVKQTKKALKITTAPPKKAAKKAKKN